MGLSEVGVVARIYWASVPVYILMQNMKQMTTSARGVDSDKRLQQPPRTAAHSLDQLL